MKIDIIIAGEWIGIAIKMNGRVDVVNRIKEILPFFTTKTIKIYYFSNKIIIMSSDNNVKTKNISEISKHIEVMRKKLNWCKQELCSRAGISYAMYSDWIKGNRGITVNKLIGIVNALNMKLTLSVNGDFPENATKISIAAKRRGTNFKK